MQRLVGLGFAVVLVGCLRGVIASHAADEEPRELRVHLHLDESYERVDFGVLSTDGGTVFSRRVEFVDGGGRSAIVHASTWHQGPGTYTIAMAFLRVDGGAGLHSTSFEMTAKDVSADGYAVFSGAMTQIKLELTERTPSALKLERTSTISREGLATYTLTNTTGQPLYPGFLRLVTQRHDADVWRHVGKGICLGQDREVLRPGESISLDAASASCLSDPLPAGSYRHSIRINTVAPAPAWETFDAASEVTRSIEVIADFGAPAAGAPSRHAFADVPASELQLGNRDSLSTEVFSPDGGCACVCNGMRVGRERLQMTQGIGGPCLTTDLDASVVLCEPLDSDRRNLGDHPPFPKPQRPR